jgi:hypothetical protein
MALVGEEGVGGVLVGTAVCAKAVAEPRIPTKPSTAPKCGAVTLQIVDIELTAFSLSR